MRYGWRALLTRVCANEAQLVVLAGDADSACEVCSMQFGGEFVVFCGDDAGGAAVEAADAATVAGDLAFVVAERRTVIGDALGGDGFGGGQGVVVQAPRCESVDAGLCNQEVPVDFVWSGRAGRRRGTAGVVFEQDE